MDRFLCASQFIKSIGGSACNFFLPTAGAKMLSTNQRGTGTQGRVPTAMWRLPLNRREKISIVFTWPRRKFTSILHLSQ